MLVTNLTPPLLLGPLPPLWVGAGAQSLPGHTLVTAASRRQQIQPQRGGASVSQGVLSVSYGSFHPLCGIPYHYNSSPCPVSAPFPIELCCSTFERGMISFLLCDHGVSHRTCFGQCCGSQGEPVLSQDIFRVSHFLTVLLPSP